MNTKAMQVVLSGCVLALVAALAGCSTGSKFDARANADAFRTVAGVPVKTELDPALLQSNTNFFTIGPGDTLELEILGDAKSHTTVVVGPDGRIYFQFLPGDRHLGHDPGPGQGPARDGIQQISFQRPAGVRVLAQRGQQAHLDPRPGEQPRHLSHHGADDPAGGHFTGGRVRPLRRPGQHPGGSGLAAQFCGAQRPVPGRGFPEAAGAGRHVAKHLPPAGRFRLPAVHAVP